MSMQGLKNIKHVPAFEEIKVTPELKAKLKQRIEHAEQHGLPRQRPERPWLRQAGYTAAAAAVLTLALHVGGAQPGPGPQSRPQPPAVDSTPVPLPPSYEPQRGRSSTVIIQAQSVDGFALTSKGLEYDAIKVTDANGNATGQAETLTQQPGAEAQPGRKIITNGEYGIRVADARAAVDRLQQDAIAAGGYVAEATLNKEANGSWVGRVVLRIPAGQVGAAVQRLGQIGAVERERQWTQDVTDQYMDLEHRIAILKEHEQRLRQLADKAATFDDWNKLATQINATRVEIENLTGRLKLLANQVDFAVLNIQVLQPAPGQPPLVLGATSFGGQLGEAFINSLRQLGALGRQAALGAAALAPYGVPLGLVLGGFLIRRRRTRRTQP